MLSALVPCCARHAALSSATAAWLVCDGEVLGVQFGKTCLLGGAGFVSPREFLCTRVCGGDGGEGGGGGGGGGRNS